MPAVPQKYFVEVLRKTLQNDFIKRFHLTDIYKF